MSFKRVVPIAMATVMALLSTPVGAQESPVTIPVDVGSTPTTQPSAPATVPIEAVIPETPNLELVPQAPPPVNEEIAAVLENERRAAVVEDAKAVAAVEQLAADAIVAASQGVVDQAHLAVDDALAVVADKQTKLDSRLTELKQSRTDVNGTRSRAAEIGVEMYTATGSERDPRTSLVVSVLANDDVPDASTAKAYRDVVADAAFGDLQAAKAEVVRVKKTVKAAEAVVQEATRKLQAASEAARGVEADLADAQKQANETKNAGDKRVAVASAAAPSLKSTELSGGLEILGDPLVSAADLAAFARKGGKPHPSIDLEQLATIFIEEGKAEGVRSDVAWVQAIIETGWFSFGGSMVHVDDYNYAGVGACDSCSRGIIFNSMTDGVRTQIQLLRTYATKGLRTADLANPPPRLTPERSFVRGCCGTWMKLSGVWATGPSYGIKILTVYNQLLSFAATQRSL